MRITTKSLINAVHAQVVQTSCSHGHQVAVKRATRSIEFQIGNRLPHKAATATTRPIGSLSLTRIAAPISAIDSDLCRHRSPKDNGKHPGRFVQLKCLAEPRRRGLWLTATTDSLGFGHQQSSFNPNDALGIDLPPVSQNRSECAII